MHHLKLISLENCPYSEGAENYLNEKKIKFKLFRVNSKNKENFKKHMQTFPQLYLIDNNKEILLGGFDKIREIDLNLYKINFDDAMKYLNKTFHKVSRKNKLRIIQTFNLK